MSRLDGARWVTARDQPPAAERFARPLHAILTAVAARDPDRLAAVCRGQGVTYAAFLARVGDLARGIAAAAAPPGPMAVLLPPGLDYLAALFAGGAAGRTLLLLTGSNPAERNAALLAQAGATLAVCGDDPGAIGAVAGLALVSPRSGEPGRETDWPEGGLSIDAPAFLLPTSGSTGTPKLVVHSQRTMAQRAFVHIDRFRLTPDDRALFDGGHTSYGALREFLAVLCSGGTVCAVDPRVDGIRGILDAMRAQRVTTLRTFVSLFRTVARLDGAAAAFAYMRLLRFGAEPPLAPDIRAARALVPPGCVIANSYGSTESINCAWEAGADDLADGAPVPAGWIDPDGEYLLVDDDGAPVPAGMPGELIISSRYQSPGDWRDGQCDQERYRPDPRDPARRLFATGDLARIQDDRSLVILGRKDLLVKINGQRVALLEIETALLGVPGCASCAVIAAPGSGAAGVEGLTAFLTPAQPPGSDLAARARAHLAARLPTAMVPRHWRVIPALPLLPNGKTDRQALLAWPDSRDPR